MRGSGPFERISDPVTPAPVEGPCLFRQGARWILLYDRFLEDRYGASTSMDGRRWRIFRPLGGLDRQFVVDARKRL